MVHQIHSIGSVRHPLTNPQPNPNRSRPRLQPGRLAGFGASRPWPATTTNPPPHRNPATSTRIRSQTRDDPPQSKPLDHPNPAGHDPKNDPISRPTPTLPGSDRNPDPATPPQPGQKSNPTNISLGRSHCRWSLVPCPFLWWGCSVWGSGWRLLSSFCSGLSLRGMGMNPLRINPLTTPVGC